MTVGLKTAATFDGIGAFGEGIRLIRERLDTPFSLFRKGSRFDIVRVGATSILKGGAIIVVWNIGLLAGSVAATKINGGGQCE